MRIKSCKHKFGVISLLRAVTYYKISELLDESLVDSQTRTLGRK